MSDKIFGRYEVVKELGRGSFGTVYSVIDGVSGKKFALKVFTPRWIKPHLIERFRREFALVARMPHPRIIKVFDFGQEKDKYYFTMELIEGKTLEDRKPSKDEALNILCDVAEGLAFIHNRGILHLDLKPGNIFLTKNGAVIGDFGLARAVGENEEIASGTVAYIAPEILKGYSPDMRADLYSLGVIAFEMFTGNNPFAGESISESINLQLSLPITDADLVDVPDKFRKLLLSLLDKDPMKRPNNAYTVWRSIANILGLPDNPELRSRYLPQSTLVGRDEIISKARQLIPTIKGKFLWSLRGKRGIGYTRMLDELRIVGQLSNFYPVIVSQYSPLESLVTQLLSWEFGDPLRRHLPTLLWAVPELTKHPTIANVGVTLSSTEPDSEDIYAHLLALIEEISEMKPLLIMFEDGIPMKFINALAQRQSIGKIFFVAKNISKNDLNIPMEAAELEPLSLTHLHIWINSALGSVDGLNDLVRHLQKGSSGLPREIDSMLKRLISDGFLVPGEERWRFSLAKREKVSSIAPAEICDLTLKFIALNPEGVPYSVLGNLIGEKWYPIAISELLASGKIKEREKWNSLVYFLTNPESAKDILPRDEAELKELKLKSAQAFVGLSELPEFVLYGAKMFYELNDPEKAVKYTRSILKKLKAKYKLDLILESYDLAAKCSEKIGDKQLWFRAVKKKANTFQTLGEIDKAIAVYRTLLAKVQKNADIQKETSVLIDLSGALIQAGKFDEAYSFLNEALEFSRQINDSRLELFSLVNIAAVLQARSELTEAANIFWQARNIATQIQNNAALVTIEINLGYILLYQGKYTQALDRLLAAASIAEQEKLIKQRFASLLGLSIVYRRLGNIELAKRTVVELKEFAHLPLHKVNIQLEQMFVNLYAGTLENPQKTLEKLIPDLKSLPHTSYNSVMEKLLPLCVLSGIPTSELEYFPSIPTGELAGTLWEALMSFEAGQYETSAETAEKLIRNIKYLSENAEIWCAAVQIIISSLSPQQSIDKLEKLMENSPNDFFVQGYLWQRIAEIYSQKLPDPERGQKALNKAQEFFSKLDNKTKLAELEHIADYLRGSRYGGDAGLLLEVAKAFTSTLEWESLVTVILDRALEVSGANRAILITIDGDNLTPIATRYENGKTIPVGKLKFSTTAVRKAVETRKSLLVESVPEDEDLAAQQSILDLRILMVIAVPLICHDELFGVLYADAEVKRATFSQRTVRLLEALGEFAAMALYNAKLYGDLVAERDALRAQTREFFGTDFIGGEAKSIQELFPKISAVAKQDITVLLLGETGTGKDLLAKIIHSRSQRSDGPFIVLNCAAVPETLLEAELFGYEKGAFTGATHRQLGKLELADKGTLFLDEIGDMSPALQAKLLTSLETGEFTRLGGNKVIKTDVRIIAATNRELEKEIENGNFREDLYYRISTVRIRIPPLRERREDIPLLAQFFLKKAAEKFGKKIQGFSPEVASAIREYRWPGNVRQLKNAIEEMALFAQRKIITPELLPDYIKKDKTLSEIGEKQKFIEPSNYEEFKKIKQELGRDFEKWAIEKLLIKYNYNVSKAAKEFGIHRTRLHQLITKYDLRRK